MISSKKLIQLAWKWQKMAAIKRQKISYPRSGAEENLSSARKGHFVVYTIDKARFTVPLEYLTQNVFRELLRLSEEEFGLPTDGPITLVCDSTFLKYVMPLLRRRMSEDLEKALLTSLITTCHFSASSSLALQQHHQRTLICSY